MATAVAACTTACMAGTIGGAALAVPLLGFTAAGISAGSIASMFQSAYLGGVIAQGGWFATLQSVGVTGLAASTKAALSASCAAGCAALGL